MNLLREPTFPTRFHGNAAKSVYDHFLNISKVDTILTVNSCARGLAVPESDLDFAILLKPGTTSDEVSNIESEWIRYAADNGAIKAYKLSGPFAQLHLDIIDGYYVANNIEIGEPIDSFELEIGNQICYSASIGELGTYFQELQNKWLPFYKDDLRSLRLSQSKDACEHDLNHLTFYIKRQLNFYAFDLLYKAFQKYLQALFISNKRYPIAYNKWIREQLLTVLQRPDLYDSLLNVMSISNIESNEINYKAEILKELLQDIPFR